MIFNSGFYAVVAKQTVDFIAAGISNSNTRIIFLLDGCPKSYVPDRPVNAINRFEAGKGYYIVVKSKIDLGEIVSNDSVNLNMYLLNDFIPLYKTDEIPCPAGNITYIAKDIGKYLNLKNSDGAVATMFSEVRFPDGQVIYDQPTEVSAEEYIRYARIFFDYKASTGSWIKSYDISGIPDFPDFVQSDPSDTWIVNHNSGKKRDLQLFSMNGDKILGDVIQVSNNQTVAKFLTGVSGYARII